MEVRTVQHDTLDAVMWRYLGTTNGIERVIGMNRHLRNHGTVLPAGVQISLPDEAPAPSTMKLVRLWD